MNVPSSTNSWTSVGHISSCRRIDAASFSVPKPRHGILFKLVIGSDDRNTFDDRLRDHHTIEWITMMERQRNQLGAVNHLNRQNREAVVSDDTRDELIERCGQDELLGTHFDRDLPIARSTQ